MSPEYQDRLFQPFTQIGEGRSGSGLGLAICNKLVQQMGGDLALLSRPGAGSCFYFTLTFPLEYVDKQHVESGGVKGLSVSNPGHLSILLVDDDEMNCFYGCEVLMAMGLEVMTANDGLEATELLRANDFDLILMDISMPVMDGYEATQIIREEQNTDGLKIVALTAHAIVGERERCLQAGMNDYMTKPFSQQDLQQMLDKWLLFDK